MPAKRTEHRRKKERGYAQAARVRHKRGARKPPGYCDRHGIVHAMVHGPLLPSDPAPAQPIMQCANCGTTRELQLESRKENDMTQLAK